MDFHTEITNILEQMPEDTARIAVKVGKRRDQMRHIQNLYPPFSDGNVIDCLEENGLGSSLQYARLFFYDSNKQKLQSKSVNQLIENEENQQTDISIMVDGFLSMAAEMRRFVAVQNESINTLVNRQSDLMAGLFETKEEMMVERAAAIGLDMELQAVKEEAEHNYKTQAIKAVSNAAQSFAENYQQNISSEKLVSLIMENPNYIDDALENEELTNLIAQKIAAKALSK